MFTLKLLTNIHAIMFNSKPRKLNVNVNYASFKSAHFKRRISPVHFTLPNGESHHIAKIRRALPEKIGDNDALQIHFVVETTEERFFHIVYNHSKMTWTLSLEIEDKLILEDRIPE